MHGDVNRFFTHHAVSPSIPILIYHNIDTRFEYSITRLPPERFRRHLDWLVRNGYRTVCLSDVLQALAQRRPLPDRSVVIAFDDGMAGVGQYALPLLRARRFTCTVFPVAGYVGTYNTWDANIGGRRFRHLDWDELAALRDAGAEIGSHTMGHPDLTALPDRPLRYELARSRALLEERLGTAVSLLSCPFGKYAPRVADAAFEAGYTGLVVVRRKGIDAHPTGGYILPGIGVYRTTGTGGLRRKVERRPAFWLMRAIERGIGFCAGQTPRWKGRPAYDETDRPMDIDRRSHISGDAPA